MADISAYLAAILAAVYGEDVRGSIHDAIEIINDVSEVVLSTGTAVSSASSSSTGFFTDSLYLNTDNYELWKCVGTDSWQSLGVLKGADGSDGPAGADGNKWYIGTGISGKAVNPTVYSGSGVTNAQVDDCYLNNIEGAIYHCTLGGAPSVATWVYDLTIAGGGGSYSAGTGIDISAANVISIDANISDLNDVAVASPSTGQYIKYTGTKWENANFPAIPSAANDATLTINQNGTSAGTFTANSATDTTINISTDTWFGTTGTVSSGSVSFSGIDDSAGTNGYELFVNVTSSSTNKSPSSEISTISGEGTASMSITFTTDADNGASCKLRIIK